jgi:hypothetical protein
MILLLCLQLLFADNCDSVHYKIKSLINHGFISRDFDMRHAKVLLPQHLWFWGRRYIYYDEYGFPIFEPFAIATYPLKTTGNRQTDKEILYRAGFKPIAGFDVHHPVGKDYVIVVPHAIHDYIKHQGKIYQFKVQQR